MRWRIRNVKFRVNFVYVFITLVIAILSGLIFLNHRVPIQYIKFHIYLLVLPIITGLSGLIFFGERANVGPFVVDRLTWLMMTFILTLGFIIQKFSMRYLIGDMHYRKYFPFYINYCICFIGMVKWRLKVNDHVLGCNIICVNTAH